jgi:rod shape-determining protein MreC
MAPPTHRRSGHSRKAQYSLFLGYVAGGIGVAVGAIVLMLSLSNPGFLSGLRGLGTDVAAPASETAAAAKSSSDGLAEWLAGYFRAGSQNAQLKRELAVARTRLLAAEATASENRRLKALLGIREAGGEVIATARLIGSTSTSTRRFATLGAGSADGVAVGMPVRSDRGLIGRVLEVSRYTARVLLVSDTESVVPVRRARDGVDGYVEGRGDGTLRLRLNSLGINPLKPGDALVTSGSGGLFRPGTPIAVVWKVTSDGAIARVLSDPASADYIVVERAWAEDLAANSAAPAGAPAP